MNSRNQNLDLPAKEAAQQSSSTALPILKTALLPEGWKLTNNFGLVTAFEIFDPDGEFFAVENPRTLLDVETRINQSLLKQAFSLGANAIISRGETIYLPRNNQSVIDVAASGEAVFIEFPDLESP